MKSPLNSIMLSRIPYEIPCKVHYGTWGSLLVTTHLGATFMSSSTTSTTSVWPSYQSWKLQYSGALESHFCEGLRNIGYC